MRFLKIFGLLLGISQLSNFAVAQENTCDSVLLYAGRNIEVNLSNELKQDFHYLARCDERFKSGSLKIAYEAFSLGGNASSSSQTCTTETDAAKAQSSTTIISNLAVSAAIEAWSQCQKLKAAKMSPDITISGGTFTASIKNEESTTPQKITLDYLPDDSYGPYKFSCQVTVAGTPTASVLPATVEMKANERAAIRCNIPIHQYVAGGNVLETIRPGGVIAIDTVSESFALAIYHRDSSLSLKKQDASVAILQQMKQLIAQSSARLHNCSIPNDGAYVNAFDVPVDFTCPADQVLVGESSVHNNHFEDRQFRFRCCSIAIIPPN